jgi:hypothetical protein
VAENPHDAIGFVSQLCIKVLRLTPSHYKLWNMDNCVLAMHKLDDLHLTGGPSDYQKVLCEFPGMIQYFYRHFFTASDVI